METHHSGAFEAHPENVKVGLYLGGQETHPGAIRANPRATERLAQERQMLTQEPRMLTQEP
jgi:hypothetical protein